MLNKRNLFIFISLLVVVALVFRACHHKQVNSLPKKPWITPEERKELKHWVISAVKKEGEKIKVEVEKELKEKIFPPDVDLDAPSHFTLQPGIGVVYIGRPRLDLDIHFWRHYHLGALIGCGINLGTNGTNQTVVKGFIAGTYTFPFVGFQNVSIFLGTSERVFTTLDIKKAEIAGGIRLKLPYMEDL